MTQVDFDRGTKHRPRLWKQRPSIAEVMRQYFAARSNTKQWTNCLDCDIIYPSSKNWASADRASANRSSTLIKTATNEGDWRCAKRAVPGMFNVQGKERYEEQGKERYEDGPRRNDQSGACPSSAPHSRCRQYIGVSKSSLEKWRVSGRGPRYCKIGRIVVYPTDHLDQWLDGNLRKSTSDEGTQPA